MVKRVAKYRHRTRRRPHRVLSQSQKIVVNLINAWERRRKKGKLVPPKYREPRRYTKPPLTARHTDLISALGLLPATPDLLAVQRIADVERIKAEHKQRMADAVKTEQQQPQAAPPPPDAKADAPSEAGEQPDETWLLGKTLPNRAFLLRKYGLASDDVRGKTVRALVTEFAAREGVRSRLQMETYLSMLRAQQRAEGPGALDLGPGSFNTPQRLLLSRAARGSAAAAPGAAAAPPGPAQPNSATDESQPGSPEAQPLDASAIRSLMSASMQRGVPTPQPASQVGNGQRIKPLYASQCDAMLQRYRPEGYLGCFSRDTITEACPALKHFDRFAMIVNLDVSTGDGDHWCAIWGDKLNEKEVDWYDSLAEPVPTDILMAIKTLVNAWDCPWYLKLKTSTVKGQSDTSVTCGLHCIKFIQDRYAGKSFAESSGYSECRPGAVIQRREKQVRAMYHMGAGSKFPYI